MLSCCICFHLFCMDFAPMGYSYFAIERAKKERQKQPKRPSVRKKVLPSSHTKSQKSYTKSQKRRRRKKVIEEKKSTRPKPVRPSVPRTTKPPALRKKMPPKPPSKIRRSGKKVKIIEEKVPTRPKPKRLSVPRTKRSLVPRKKRPPKPPKKGRRKKVIEEEEPRSQKQPKRPSARKKRPKQPKRPPLPPVIEYVIILETGRSEVEKIEAFREEVNKKVKKYLEQPEEERSKEPPSMSFGSFMSFVGVMSRVLFNAIRDKVNVIITSPQVLEALLKSAPRSRFLRDVKDSWGVYKDVDTKFAILVSKNKIKEFSFAKGSELSGFGLSNNLIKIDPDKIKDTFFNKDFDRIDEKSLIEVFSPEKFPLKLIHLMGHGGLDGEIAALSPYQYAAFIKAINKKGCLFFDLISCYAGGKNLAIAHKEIIIRESLDILLKDKIRFPIAINSLTDAVAKQDPVTFFRRFFDGLKRLFTKRTRAGVKTWIKDPFKSILKNISMGCLDNLPSIWFPGVDRFFSAVDVDNNITMITDSVLIGHELKERMRLARQRRSFKGVKMKTVTREPAPDKTRPRPPVKAEVERVPTKDEIVGVDIGKIFPIHVINKRAILVYPVVIALPIEIVSTPDKPKGVPSVPALVSMVPGPATHYFQTIDMRQFTLHKIVDGLFCQIRVEEPKLFFIKELEFLDEQSKIRKANNFYARTFYKEDKDELFVYGGYLSDDAIPVTFFYSSRKKKFYSSRKEKKEKEKKEKEKKEKEKKDGFSKFLDYINPLFCHIIDAAPSKELLLLSLNRVDAEYQVRRMIGKCFSEKTKKEKTKIIKKLKVRLEAMFHKIPPSQRSHQIPPYQMLDEMSKSLEQKEIYKGRVIGKVLTVLKEDKSWPMVLVGVRQSSGAIQKVLCSLCDNNIEKGSIVTIDKYDFNGRYFGKIISSRPISLAPEVSTTGIVEEVLNVEDVKKVLELEKLKGILKEEVEEELLKKSKLFKVKMIHKSRGFLYGDPDVFVVCDIDPKIEARLIKIGDTVRVKIFPLQKDRGIIMKHYPKSAWRRKKH